MPAAATIPRVGLLAKLRNRRGVITAVEPHDTGSAGDGTVHAVRIEYTDQDGPPSELVLWEQEPSGELVSANRLPEIDRLPPIRADEFDAVVRAARWSALQPLIGPHGERVANARLVSAPLFGAVQAEDFQIEPVLRAIEMPRVSLLIADDVGLGKTVEAGLILSELILRRRIRRVLVLCPASLKQQWHQEMQEKFSLNFDVVDRPETHALQRRLGLDANPWRAFSRIVASYHYLRQPDVLEQFLSTCRTADGVPASAQLPWDLLIVDEAHNLMPSNFGRDSDLTEMLRQITPWFEHKLFLTATPHNGHTRCFSGLMELLDPVRFTQTAELSAVGKLRIQEVVVRRLKREINEMDERAGGIARFTKRKLTGLPLQLGANERALSEAFGAFRRAVKAATAANKRGDQLAGSFAVEILNKRLLSSPATFADSWWRFQEGLRDIEQEASAADVRSAARASGEDVEDDREREGRAAVASKVVGTWLRPLQEKLARQMDAVDKALRSLGLEAQAGGRWKPRHDSRLDALLAWIDAHLRVGGTWREDERLIIFTEYKTTLDYLQAALTDRLGGGNWLDVLYGGMDAPVRAGVKAAFNDPKAPVRILLATDTASEGLNLQETARYLLHYDIPWNPSRLEQRNGRLDRHGQGRDVTVFHFASDDDADLRFLAHVVAKVQEIREDLGAMGEVFEAAFEKQFQDAGDTAEVLRNLDGEVALRLGTVQAELAPEKRQTISPVSNLLDDADLRPEALAKMTDLAMRSPVGERSLDGPDARNRYHVRRVTPEWREVIDDSLRIQTGPSAGAMPAVTFDATACLQQIGERKVFRVPADLRLLHLGHPMLRHTIQHWTRKRFLAQSSRDVAGFTRWTVRRGELDAAVQALVLLTVEELAVNGLREPVHHWVRTLRFPVLSRRLLPALPYLAPDADIPPTIHVVAEDTEAARELWSSIEDQVAERQRVHAAHLSAEVRAALADVKSRVQAAETERFKGRIREVEQALTETSIGRLQRELDKIRDEETRLWQKPSLFAEFHLADQQRQDQLAERGTLLEEELERRQGRYRDLVAILHRERDRVLQHVVPQRHVIAGEVQVMTLAVEIRLPIQWGA